MLSLPHRTGVRIVNLLAQREVANPSKPPEQQALEEFRQGRLSIYRLGILRRSCNWH